MEKQNKSIAVSRQGMDRDTHPMGLNEQSYTMAFNVNTEDDTGNGYPMLQNEHSNLLCSRYKEGYKVVGFVKDINEDKTYYFLTNPITGYSEIGYISDVVDNVDNVDIGDIELQCGCDIKNILDTPLEDKEQEELCGYTTIIHDNCNKCLNFNINNPIYDIQIKHEKCGKRLYWTDNNNPPRYLDLSDLDWYTYKGEKDCEGYVEGITCLECDKLRIFPLHSKPCITPTSIQYGGRLKMGTYEFLIAYCDAEGNSISQFYSITNPISIFDENNNVLSQPEIADQTNLAIRLEVANLDKRFGYYKVAVIQRTDVNGATSYFIEGVHSINDTIIAYFSEDGKQRVALKDILYLKPIYERSESMVSSNGYLLQYGLTAKKELNLQPVVNLLGSFLRWHTSITTEDIYKEGTSTSLYKGYMRDEVYAFSIRFITDEGYETSLFPLVGRPPSAYDLEEINNLDYESIDKFVPRCSENERKHRWQYYNTAKKIGQCNNTIIGNDTVTNDEEKYCIVEDVYTEDNGNVIIPNDIIFTNLIEYVEEYRDKICDTNTVFYNPKLCKYLTYSYDTSICNPSFEGNCSSIELITEENFIQNTKNETTEKVDKPFLDYERSSLPKICDFYITTDKQLLIRDTGFEKTYLLSKESVIQGVERVYQVVYKRKNEGDNTVCNMAENIAVYFGGGTQGQSYHLNYYGGNTLSELQQGRNSVGNGTIFTNKLHKGALWFKGNMQGGEDMVLEVTPNTTHKSSEDTVKSTLLRVSVYSTCNSQDPVITSIYDSTKGILLKIDKYKIGGENYYVAIDAPITTEESYYLNTFENNPLARKYVIMSTCGCFSLFIRNTEHISLRVNYDSITIGKRQRYKARCTYPLMETSTCNPVPFEYGQFSYWESEDKYPINREMYDSSTLKINKNNIPKSIQLEFEEYFVKQKEGQEYILKEDTNFCNKNIRHIKMPSNEVTSFITSEKIISFEKSKVFPLGVYLDNEIINSFLDIAVNNKLISLEERKQITKYEIFRGDRTLNRSIISKGLLYDTYKYRESGKEIYYPNYPYNDLGADTLNFIEQGNNRELVPHPFGGTSNNRFTFHSPDIHFHKPSLPSEVSIEGYQYGKSRGNFVDVEDHSKWVILGKEAYSTATTLAIAEVVLEAAIKIAELSVQAQTANWYIAGLSSGTGAPGMGIGTGLAIALGVTMFIDGIMKVGRYRYEWMNIFRNNGQPKQFASYYTSEGFYNFFTPNKIEGEKVRGLATSKYVKPGRKIINEEGTGHSLKLNNFMRESSLFLSFGDGFKHTYPVAYYGYDNGSKDGNTNSRTTSGASSACKSGQSQDIVRNIASPYVAIKNFIPNQYQTIGSVKWIPTGYCGDVTNRQQKCEIIYGGDVFISRFSLKRKIPMYTVTSIKSADLLPFDYLQYSNIGSTRFFCNYNTEENTSILGAVFPEIGDRYSFDCLTGRNSFYVKPPSKFYLYYYGIPQFLVESEINCNFRYARKELFENFYPNIGDHIEWTQEKNVSIRHDNTYHYNNTYSKNTTMVATRTLPDTYSKEKYNCLYDYPNGVIYSLQDSSEQALTDPWLIYKPYDIGQFPTSNGKLIHMKDIESSQVLVRFERKFGILNAVDTLRERLTPDNQELGAGGMFATRMLEFKATELGYAGTQHSDMVSCEFGHFWVDAKRGQVFKVEVKRGQGSDGSQNGIDLKEITIGLRNWFKEQLPFKILKGKIEGLTGEKIDNIFRGIGITMGWDSRYKRVFLTKKDYIVNANFIGKLTYKDGEIYLYNQPVSFTNREVFEDSSFTLAYSPILDRWISYYSFKPDYYVSHNNYFQTGINYSSNPVEEGIWSHLVTNKSFQVFYGKRYGWMIEFPVKEGYVNKIINSVSYWMDARRYHNEYDFAEKRDEGFNKAWIYNNTVNSGQLNLVTEIKNDLYQKTQYPKTNNNSEDILITQEDKQWNFNYFYDRVRKDTNNVPIWLKDTNDIDKVINMKALTYKGVWKDRLRGDWFLVRLAQDKETRFKQIFKWSIIKETIY